MGDKVIKMCDEMVDVLKKEQVDDDDKKEYCTTQFDLSDDSKKALERRIADHENAIATAKEGIATLTEEIAALEAGIKALDKSVAEATEQRKSENTEFKALMASNGAAKELLGFAKNRLNKFYDPKLYKAPPKADSFVQISSNTQHKADPGPAPKTWEKGEYKKSEDKSGAIEMINLLIRDLDKDMATAKAEEKNAQEDYE